jgi:hypothetical protein
MPVPVRSIPIDRPVAVVPTPDGVLPARTVPVGSHPAAATAARGGAPAAAANRSPPVQPGATIAMGVVSAPAAPVINAPGPQPIAGDVFGSEVPPATARSSSVPAADAGAAEYAPQAITGVVTGVGAPLATTVSAAARRPPVAAAAADRAPRSIVGVVGGAGVPPAAAPQSDSGVDWAPAPRAATAVSAPAPQSMADVVAVAPIDLPTLRSTRNRDVSAFVEEVQARSDSLDVVNHAMAQIELRWRSAKVRTAIVQVAPLVLRRHRTDLAASRAAVRLLCKAFRNKTWDGDKDGMVALAVAARDAWSQDPCLAEYCKTFLGYIGRGAGLGGGDLGDSADGTTLGGGTAGGVDEQGPPARHFPGRTGPRSSKKRNREEDAIVSKRALIRSDSTEEVIDLVSDDDD